MIGTAFQTIEVERRDDVLLVRLNRPERLNAINLLLADELLGAVAGAPATGACAVVIAGNGRAFCAGADIEEARSVSGVTEALSFLTSIREMFYGISRVSLPVIAAIHGVAFGGGCEIALACDFRIAAEDARLGLPEVKIGVLPGGGGMARLPALIGVARAKELILTGEPIGAVTAERYGLVTRAVPADTQLEAALELAQSFADKPAGTIALAKRAIDSGAATDADAAAEIEYLATAAVFGTDDRIEGMSAFLGKRKASFRPR